MGQAKRGFTRPPSSGLCRGTWNPVTQSWEDRWRTWYPLALWRSVPRPLSVYPALLPQDVPPGRASSHWEARTLQGSIMTAVLGEPAEVRVDAVTLAALQDTGWYTVNLTRAQSLVWGQGE